ncbi:MAG: hypothetical protein Q9169_004426 [Polycauliona sp. 2 TL-2023]
MRWMAMPWEHAPSHQVQTSNGLIIGHGAPNASSVIEYLGIPYAQPPIGDLRFAAPVAIQGDTKSIFNASHYITDYGLRGCPVAASPPSSRPYPEATDQFGEIAAAFTGSIDRNRSEDCLALNIWSKDTANKSKPVIVYFHGGRYSSGTSDTPFYNGQYLAANQDIIIVTINFRLNLFGFPGAPNTTQNIGLLDQRLAIEWIHQNIRSFGGSPNRIVIAGQSSGSVAVDYWSFAYIDDPLVSGYIQHSGNAFSFGLNNNELAVRHWYDVSELLGCGREGDMLPCMRAISNVTAIVEAVGGIEPPPSSNPARVPPVFQPTPDGVTVFDDYRARYERGDFSRLPVLQGQTANEAGWYKTAAFRQNTTLPASAWADFNAASFTCPIAFTARTRASFDIPTYRFVYHGDWESLRLYSPSAGNGNEEGSGAYHGSDVQMVLGNSEDIVGGGVVVGESGDDDDDEERRKMEEVMMGAWAAFARDPRSGLEEEMGWVRYQEVEGEVIRLGFGGRGEATFVGAGSYDHVCGNVTVEG